MKWFRRSLLSGVLLFLVTFFVSFQTTALAESLPASPDYFYLDQPVIIDEKNKNLVEKNGKI